MPKTTTAKPGRKRPAAAKPKGAAPPEESGRAPTARAKGASPRGKGAGGKAGAIMCRSCGKRPGQPTAILGQMTQSELCPPCIALRKARIRANRAAARGLRASRVF